MSLREKKKIPAPEILSGWKNIARHLGMGVRTVQRYERQMGLPIRRPAGKMRGAVLATKSELDAWIAASPIRESFHLAKASPLIQSKDVDAMRRGLEEMQVLNEQMKALRSEVRDSTRLLRENVLTLRGDLWRGSWEAPPPLLGLESNPKTRHLLARMPTEQKGRTAN